MVVSILLTLLEVPVAAAATDAATINNTKKLIAFNENGDKSLCHPG